MTLRDLELLNAYNTSKDDLINHFFVPSLKNSIRYDRGVGFFSSGWLFETFIGMADFAENGGKARWITSPILSKEDWDALYLGDLAKTNQILKNSLDVSITDLKEKIQHDTLVAFAWMIADGIIEFKLAKPRNKLTSEFHAKVGIFTDINEDSISFSGSYNDSINGLHNYESIKVFRSWDATADYVVQEKYEFDKLWNNEDLNVAVYDIPDAAKAKILQLKEYSTRPYNKSISESLNYFFYISEKTAITPQIPKNLTLRDYQKEALAAWATNNHNGIFEMATGTGKTITALTAAVNQFQEKERLLTLILCPYVHLAEQWKNEAEKFGFQPVLVAESKSKWQDKAANLLRDFSANRRKHATIITTNASFRGKTLLKMLNDYQVLGDTLLIADEMHHCGSLEMLRVLPYDTPFRLGLSATPIREYDETGSESLINFFGDVVYSFNLSKAIEGKFLTPYFYEPIFVNITSEEFRIYSELSSKLQRMHPNPKEPISESALRIAIKRTRVLNNSETKLEWLNRNIHPENEMYHTLFYSGDQIFDDVLQLLGYNKGLLVHSFTYKESLSDRSRLLEQFSEKKLQALVSMKCLDEGVDIPPTRTAYFLASSSVSREFIQRRGRILRNSPGKTMAKVIDLIAVPPQEYLTISRSNESFSFVKSILRRELKRVKEFSELALNRHTAMNMFVPLANHFDLLHLT